MSKSLPQLTAVTTLQSTDIIHINRNNIDYKIAYSDLLAKINSDSQFLSVAIPITTAEILALDTTPKQLVAAPGAGYALEAVSAFAKIVYAGTPYATVVDLHIYTDTSNVPQLSMVTGTSNTILESTVSRMVAFYVDASVNYPLSATQTMIIENKALMISPLAGLNPTAGNSDITIYLNYRKVAL